MEIVELGGGGPKRLYAVVNGEIPTEAEFKRIRRDVLPIHVRRLPDGHSGLDFLEPVSDVLPGLIVTDYRCTNAGAVQSMVALRELDLITTDLKHDLDVTVLSKLEDFAGSWAHIESVVDCLTLERLYLSGATSTIFGALRSRITRLTLTSARSVDRIDAGVAASSLKRLSIHGARRLDLSGIVHCDDLEKLELVSCSSLLNARALVALPALKSVVLEKCPDIRDWRTLENLSGPVVSVNGRSPFGADFREAVRARENWYFSQPPSATSGQEFVLHPALPVPLRYPQDIVDDLTSNELPNPWFTLSSDQQWVLYAEELERALAWCASHGADSIVLNASGLVSKPKVVPFTPASVDELTSAVRTLGDVRLRAGTRVLVEIGDTVEEGLHLFSTTGAPDLPLPEGVDVTR